MAKESTQQSSEVAVPEVMDLREVCDYLRLGKSKIYAMIRLKKIPASRIGRQYRFSKSVIDAWLKEQLITQPDQPQGTFFSPREKT